MTFYKVLECLVYATDMDKTKLYCLCQPCEQNWRQVKTVGDRKLWNCFVQSWNAVWTEFRLVSTQFPICTNAFTPQTGLYKTVQSPIYWGLLKTVLTCRQFCSQHCQDERVLPCPFWWCEYNTHTCIIRTPNLDGKIVGNVSLARLNIDNHIHVCTW